MFKEDQSEEPLFLDEALDIVSKFLRQTIRDYISPNLRFSRLKAEREYWETAESFLLEEIAIDWGGSYLTVSAMFEMVGVQWTWLSQHIIDHANKKAIKYLQKESQKKQNMTTVFYISTKTGEAKFRIEFKKLGIIPVFAAQTNSYEDIDISEISNNLDDLYHERHLVRRKIDRNLQLLNKAQVVIVIWSAGTNDLQVLTEVSLAYQLHLPIYIFLAEDGPPVPKYILMYSKEPYTNIEDFFNALRETVGTGRAKILSSVIRSKDL